MKAKNKTKEKNISIFYWTRAGGSNKTNLVIMGKFQLIWLSARKYQYLHLDHFISVLESKYAF